VKNNKQRVQRMNNSNSSTSRVAAKTRNNALKNKNATFIKGIKTMDDAELDNIVLTFHYPDDSIRKVNCNKLGFYDNYGKKRLSVSQIYSNIVAMQNDLQALYFEIG
tara:strand:+ start:934 stop:1254 length:321 start_codon:yes stop_codon:yes gene_type:complete